VFSTEIKLASSVAEAVEANQPLQAFPKTKNQLRSLLEALASEFLGSVAKLESKVSK
jgi:hypothetical protein